MAAVDAAGRTADAVVYPFYADATHDNAHHFATWLVQKDERTVAQATPIYASAVELARLATRVNDVYPYPPLRPQKGFP